MRKKIKDINWFDIKTKFKQLLRKFLYSYVISEIICYILISYMLLVYYTSRKKFINLEKFTDIENKKDNVILVCLHNKIMMMPFLIWHLRKINPNISFMDLASKHGDGRMVGNIMKKFGFKDVSGSTNKNHKKNKSVALRDLRKIILNLKNNSSIAITPDGPNGPRYKINSQIVNIAKISGIKILISGNNYSKKKELNSWDKFQIPLPFGKICYFFGKKISISKDIKEKDFNIINQEIEREINIADKMALKNNKLN